MCLYKGATFGYLEPSNFFSEIVTTRHKHATVLKQRLAINELLTTKLKSSSLGFLSSHLLILINLSIHMNLYDVGQWKLLHSRLLDLLASAACFGGML